MKCPFINNLSDNSQSTVWVQYRTLVILLHFHSIGIVVAACKVLLYLQC